MVTCVRRTDQPSGGSNHAVQTAAILTPQGGMYTGVSHDFLVAVGSATLAGRDAGDRPPGTSPPGAQLSLLEEADGWRYQAFATNTRVEDRIKAARDRHMVYGASSS